MSSSRVVWGGLKRGHGATARFLKRVLRQRLDPFISRYVTLYSSKNNYFSFILYPFSVRLPPRESKVSIDVLHFAFSLHGYLIIFFCFWEGLSSYLHFLSSVERIGFRFNPRIHTSRSSTLLSVRIFTTNHIHYHSAVTPNTLTSSHLHIQQQ